MSNHNYGEIKASTSSADNPDPETQSYQESVPLKLPVRPPPPMSYGAAPGPPPYQSSYGPPDAQFIQGLGTQSQQTIFITPIQPTKEPDHLIYSIFTLMCCFLPLGIAALIFSVKTQEANRYGNAAAAQKNSRLSRITAHLAFGFGIVIWALYITVLAIRAKKHNETIDNVLVNLSTISL